MSKNKKINLKDFLKNYTAISHKFIDEYYKFYEKCEQNTFGINLDDVIKYLDIQNSEKFITNFRKNYIEKVDYIREVITNEKKEEGKKYSMYYLNLDTFERLCMMSKAKKANKVRDYFIILRKFIHYYKSNISDMIIETAKKKPNGVVYIILTNKDKQIFKFGESGNIRKRLQNYATGKDKHPDIKFIMLVENKNEVEKCVKNLVKKYQFKPNKEIYKVNIEIIKDAIFDCASLQKKYLENYDDTKMDSYIIFNDVKIPKIKRSSKKKDSRKISKRNSRKNSKRNSRKNSKRNSRKNSKKSSRKNSKRKNTK